MFRTAKVALHFAAYALPFAAANFGPYVDIGSSSSPHIYSATSTLVLGDYPEDNPSSHISIWCGMETTTGDLVQSIAGNYQCTCWDVFTYTLTNNGNSGTIGPQAPAVPGDHVTMDYVYSDSTGNYTQTLSVNGVVKSTLDVSTGEATGWGTAVECNGENNCGTVPAHSWINTQIVLFSPDVSFGNTVGNGDGGSGGAASTPDGGKTWNLATINIPEWTFG